MNQSPFKFFATSMINPLLKLTLFVLLVKYLLLLYKRIIQPYLSLLWLQLAAHFAIFHKYDTSTFKTKALHFTSNEERVKRLLLPYKWLIQPYLGFLLL